MTRAHENPVDASNVTDEIRATLLDNFTDRIEEEFGVVPKLMPLDSSGKAPIITGRSKLDSPKGRSFLVDARDAADSIRDYGVRGFAIYLGLEYCNTEKLASIDHDDMDAFPAPSGDPTLEVMSGSGRGRHEYYRRGDDIPIPPEDTSNAKVNPDGADGEVGEVRTYNWFTIVPGSIHPSGGVYHICEDRPIATLHDDDLTEPMKPEVHGLPSDSSESSGSSGGTPTVLDTPEGEMPDDSEIQRRLERAFSNSHDGGRIKKVYDGQYAAAGFEDRSSAEFWLANRLDSFVGLGDHRVVERVMDNANLEKWSQRKDRGYRNSVLQNVGHQDWYADDTDADTSILTDREGYTSIDEVEFPAAQSIILDKPPREGGSFALFRDHIPKGDPFIVAAAKHAILEYHLETTAELLKEGTVVHLEGLHRVCDHADEDGICPNNPGNDVEARTRASSEVADVMYRKTSITADDAPEGICPAWFLREVAEQASIVLTVPQLLPGIDREFGDMRLILDEEQSIDEFRPGSVELVTLVEMREPDGNVRVQVASEANIAKQTWVLEEIREQIRADQEERAEEAEDRDWRPTGIENNILAAIDAAQEIRNALGITNAEAMVEDADIDAVVEEIHRRLEDFELPERTVAADKLRDAINDCCARWFWDEGSDPSALLEALLFPYEDNPFSWKRTPGEHKLRLIGDRGREPFHADMFREFKQISIIAGPQGERFLSDLGIDGKVIEIGSFKYDQRFAVLPVGWEGEDGLEPVYKQRERVRDVSMKLNERNLPHFSIVGTKDQAKSLVGAYPERANVISTPESPAMTLLETWSTGTTVVMYENSSISRGIDAPVFDVSCVISPGFALPYWEARKERWRGVDNEKYIQAVAIENELKSRELTNAVLRMAQTYDTADEYGTKIIVVAASDVKDLKFLDHRRLPHFESATRVARLLDNIIVGGGLDITISNLYRQLQRSEKKLLEVGSIEEFTETKLDRPTYSKMELEAMVEDGAVLRPHKVERVLDVIDSNGPMTTREVREAATSLLDRQINHVLKALHRTGRIEDATDSDNEGEGVKRRWKTV